MKPQLENKKFMQYGDLTDATNLIRIIQNVNQLKYIILQLKVMYKLVLKLQSIQLIQRLGTLRIFRGNKDTKSF